MMAWFRRGPMVFYGFLIYFTASCVMPPEPVIQWLKTNVTDEIPNVHFDKEPAALALQIGPSSRVAVVAVIPSGLSGDEGAREREENSWFLMSFESALRERAEGVFNFVEGLAFGGIPIMESAPAKRKQETQEPSAKEVALIEENQLDLLIRFDLSSPPRRVVLGTTINYQVEASLLNREGQRIASFKMLLDTFSSARQSEDIGRWSVGPGGQPIKSPRMKVDIKAYYHEVARLVARNLVKVLSPGMLQSEEMEIEYLDLEANQMFKEGFPPLIAE